MKGKDQCRESSQGTYATSHASQLQSFNPRNNSIMVAV